jgi:hypothetical protein
MMAPAGPALPVTAMSVVKIGVAAAFKAIPAITIVAHSEAELSILDLGFAVRERGSACWRRSKCRQSYSYGAEGCDTGFHDFCPLGAHP